MYGRLSVSSSSRLERGGVAARSPHIRRWPASQLRQTNGRDKGPPITIIGLLLFNMSNSGSGGFYENPWRIRGSVLQFDSLPSLRSPPLVSQPLGGQVLDIFQSGGYARILMPLLDASTASPVCFDGNKCIDIDRPSLWENIPYSSVFLQARPNTNAHSEVDFGSFIWSAWGSRLISEL